jgi:hypothetical protein
MARWSRSRLRSSGIAVAAILGGSLLVIPAISAAGERAEPDRPAVATPGDRIAMVPGNDGRSAFRFQAASGDRQAPFSFVSTGGTLRARQLGGARPVVQAKTGAPAARTTKAAADTYPTTLTVDSQNWTAWNKHLGLWNRDTWTYVPVDNPPNSLSATVDLPPGNYWVTAMYGIYGVNSYLLTKSFTVTNRAQTVVLAESSAREVDITVDDATAQKEMSAVWLSLPNADLVGFAGGPRTRAYVTTASVAGTTLRVHEIQTKAGASALKPSPYRYDLVKTWPHPLPAAPIAAVTTASLARTTTTLRAQGVTTEASYGTVPDFGEWTGVYLPSSLRVPATITEYVTPDVYMYRSVTYGDNQSLEPRGRTLPAGPSDGETVGVGPLAPSGRPYNDDSRRDHNRLQILENFTLTDAAGNKGAGGWDTTALTLSSGGELLGSTNGQSLSVDVPPEAQTYQLVQAQNRKVAWSQLSTKIRSEWTFRSGLGPAGARLALMDLGLSASGLDDRNRAGSEPVRLRVQPSTRQIVARSVVDTVEWSVDDGATWAELPLSPTDSGTEAVLTVPATAAFVSLRVTASNDQDGALRRTIVRALAGPATPGDETIGRTTITNVQINGGRSLPLGTAGSVEFTATFTASDPSGVASAGMYLWHGGYTTPDGLHLARTECTPVNGTTSDCTAYLYLWDMRYLMASNALAGTWRAAVWASGKDGTGFTDQHTAGSLSMVRATSVTADATPEPVRKGGTITVAGALTRADWDTWAYLPYASQSVSLQFVKTGTTTWSTVQTVKSDAAGKVKATATAGLDGGYRFVFAGDARSGLRASATDWIDVQ